MEVEEAQESHLSPGGMKLGAVGTFQGRQHEASLGMTGIHISPI